MESLSLPEGTPTKIATRMAELDAISTLADWAGNTAADPYLAVTTIEGTAPQVIQEILSEDHASAGTQITSQVASICAWYHTARDGLADLAGKHRGLRLKGFYAPNAFMVQHVINGDGSTYGVLTALSKCIVSLDAFGESLADLGKFFAANPEENKIPLMRLGKLEFACNKSREGIQELYQNLTSCAPQLLSAS